MSDRSPGVGWSALPGFDEPLDPEDIVEFHASRILVLLAVFREHQQQIRGRTKLAKLDFFVRYPTFLEAALDRLRGNDPDIPFYESGSEGTEASMIRYRYGPWDHRYFNLISYLIGRGLIRVSGQSVETYTLTNDGLRIARELMNDRAYGPIVERSTLLTGTLGKLQGSKLKAFVYDTFIDEVTKLPSGAVIAPREAKSR